MACVESLRLEGDGREFRVRRFPHETVRMGTQHLVAVYFDVMVMSHTFGHGGFPGPVPA